MLARAVRQHPERLQDILTAVEPATQHGVPEVRTTAARILREASNLLLEKLMDAQMLGIGRGRVVPAFEQPHTRDR